MEKQKNISHWIHIVVFFGMISIPLAAQIFGFAPPPSKTENRNLSARPELSLKTLYDYPAKFQQYFADTFAYRPQLVLLKNYISFHYLNTSPRRDVLVGKDKSLYYNPDEKIRIPKPYTDDELAQFRTNLEGLQQRLKARGIDLYIFVGPNSASVNREQMPDYLTKNPFPTRLDQVVYDLKRNNSPVPFIDARERLIASKELYEPYRRYDTHWNDYGAFIAYTEILNAIHARYKSVSPVPLSEFSVTVQKSPNNDLLNMTGLTGVYSEDVPVIKVNVTRAKQEIISCKFKPNCEKIRTTVENKAYPRLLMYRDSFTIKLLPFLAEHFSEANFLWTFNMTEQDLEQYNPQIVLIEIVERDMSVLKTIGDKIH